MKTPIQLMKAVYNRLYYYCAPDKVYLNRKFREVFGRDIDWKNPTTFNEKLQWLKVYNRNPLYTKLVDKYEVRQYIADKIGEEYLIPLLGVWNHFDEIDFDALPEQFVLKCTHDSASVIICRNKNNFNFDAAKAKLEANLKRNFYYNHREWPYKNIKPRIIAEKYMVDESGYELKDYKFFCFGGEPKALFVATDRNSNEGEVKFDFFDVEFNHLDMRHGHENANQPIEKPDNYDTMVHLARSLSTEFEHIRVDFYNINGKIYFGELTFFHHSGFVKFEPEEWDNVFGGMIDLRKVRK